MPKTIGDRAIGNTTMASKRIRRDFLSEVCTAYMVGMAKKAVASTVNIPTKILISSERRYIFSEKRVRYHSRVILWGRRVLNHFLPKDPMKMRTTGKRMYIPKKG